MPRQILDTPINVLERNRSLRLTLQWNKAVSFQLCDDRRVFIERSVKVAADHGKYLAVMNALMRLRCCPI